MRRSWFILGSVLTAVGCNNESEGPSDPPDPSFTARWREDGTDAYTQLRLEQRGTSVVGGFSFGSFNLGGETTSECPVTGVVALSHVSLAWDEDIPASPGQAATTYHITADGTLSADQQTLAFRLAANGVPSPDVHFYKRVDAWQ